MGGAWQVLWVWRTGELHATWILWYNNCTWHLALWSPCWVWMMKTWKRKGIMMRKEIQAGQEHQKSMYKHIVDGLVQVCSISIASGTEVSQFSTNTIANALELRLSCANPSNSFYTVLPVRRLRAGVYIMRVVLISIKLICIKRTWWLLSNL